MKKVRCETCARLREQLKEAKKSGNQAARAYQDIGAMFFEAVAHLDLAEAELLSVLRGDGTRTTVSYRLQAIQKLRRRWDKHGEAWQ